MKLLMSWINNMIKQKKEELLKLVEQFNQLQKTLQELGNKILKLQGGIEVLEEIEKGK